MFRCCIGAEPRGGNSSGRANNGNGRANKKKKQSEVFFDMPKPEGQLSSVTDQANSADHKRRKESRDKGMYTHAPNASGYRYTKGMICIYRDRGQMGVALPCACEFVSTLRP